MLSTLFLLIYPSLNVVPEDEDDGFGSLGINQDRNASVERVCIKTRPGPVSSTTSPSPLKMVDFSPPTWLTLKPIPSEKATK